MKNAVLSTLNLLFWLLVSSLTISACDPIKDSTGTTGNNGSGNGGGTSFQCPPGITCKSVGSNTTDYSICDQAGQPGPLVGTWKVSINFADGSTIVTRYTFKSNNIQVQNTCTLGNLSAQVTIQSSIQIQEKVINIFENQKQTTTFSLPNNKTYECTSQISVDVLSYTFQNRCLKITSPK